MNYPGKLLCMARWNTYKQNKEILGRISSPVMRLLLYARLGLRMKYLIRVFHLKLLAVFEPRNYVVLMIILSSYTLFRLQISLEVSIVNHSSVLYL